MFLNKGYCCSDSNDDDLVTVKDGIHTISGFIDFSRPHTIDEALELTGNGPYNISLLMALCITVLGMSLDMYGFSVLVAGCQCELQVTLTQKRILLSVPFAGAMIMCYPWTHISDRHGRRKSLLVALVASFVIAALSSLSPDWKVLAVMKFFSSSFSSCFQTTSSTLLGESCRQRYKKTYVLVLVSSVMLTPALYYTLGYLILRLEFRYSLGPFLGHFTPWRLLALIYSLPLGLAWSLLWFFYESPKFLYNDGRCRESLVVLRKIWIRNGKDPDGFPVKQLVPKYLSSNRNSPLFRTIWDKTSPLFKPPLLWITLQLYYITAVCYGTHSSFQMWFPFVMENIFHTLKSKEEGSISGLCDLVASDINYNSTTRLVMPLCKSTLSDSTVLSGIIHSISFTMVNLCLFRAASRKNLLIMTVFLLSSAAGVGATLVPEPITAMIMFITLAVTGLGLRVVSSYYGELYPDYNRGMVSCLSIIVSRGSALASNNVLGAFILSNCNATFYVWSAFIFSGVLVASRLPTGIPKEKVIDIILN